MIGPRLRGAVLAGAGVLAALVAVRITAQTQTVDGLAKLQFLEGAWKGGGLGKPGEATGTVLFAFDLDRHVLVRKNHAEFPKKPGDARAPVHDDLMVIHQEPGQAAPRAMYWDSEGHVIRYAVSIPEPGKAVFESEPSDRTLRFRLTHDVKASGEMDVEFAVAPPGGEFKTYTHGTVRKSP